MNAPLRLWPEIPTWLGRILWARLEKAAGHKYVRRIPTGNAKRPYRYFYSVSAGAGLGHESEIQEGAAFRATHSGQEGHFHVKKVEGDHVHIEHDASGHTDKVSKEAFRSMLHQEHAESIQEARDKAKQGLKDAKKFGSDKQKQIAETRHKDVEKKLGPNKSDKRKAALQHHAKNKSAEQIARRQDRDYKAAVRFPTKGGALSIVREMENAAGIDLGAVDYDNHVKDHLRTLVPEQALKRAKNTRQAIGLAVLMAKRAGVKDWRDMAEKRVVGDQTLVEFLQEHEGLRSLYVPQKAQDAIGSRGEMEHYARQADLDHGEGPDEDIDEKAGGGGGDTSFDFGANVEEKPKPKTTPKEPTREELGKKIAASREKTAADDKRLGTGKKVPKKEAVKEEASTPEKPKFVLHPHRKKDGKLVTVDPKLLDAAWKKAEPGQHIPEGGGGAEIKGRREGFKEFQKTGKPIEASHFALDRMGEPTVVDGRHRFSVLRDQGHKTIQVSVHKDEAEEFQKRFGPGGTGKQAEPRDDAVSAVGADTVKEAEKAGLFFQRSPGPHHPTAKGYFTRQHLKDLSDRKISVGLKMPEAKPKPELKVADSGKKPTAKERDKAAKEAALDRHVKHILGQRAGIVGDRTRGHTIRELMEGGKPVEHVQDKEWAIKHHVQEGMANVPSKAGEKAPNKKVVEEAIRKHLSEASKKDHHEQVHDAYLKVAGDYKSRAEISKVREEVPHLSRREVDQALKDLQGSGHAHLYGYDDPHERTHEAEAGSLTISGLKRHVMYLEEHPKKKIAKSTGVSMPSNIVKTARDEALWKRAKKAAQKSNPKDLYALTNHIYQKMTGEADAVEKSVSPDLVKSDLLYSKLEWSWVTRYAGTPLYAEALKIEEQSCKRILELDKARREAIADDGGGQYGHARSPDAAAECARIELERENVRLDYEEQKGKLALKWVTSLREQAEQAQASMLSKSTGAQEPKPEKKGPAKMDLQDWLQKASGAETGSVGTDPNFEAPTGNLADGAGNGEDLTTSPKPGAGAAATARDPVGAPSSGSDSLSVDNDPNGGLPEASNPGSPIVQTGTRFGRELAKAAIASHLGWEESQKQLRATLKESPRVPLPVNDVLQYGRGPRDAALVLPDGLPLG